MKCLALSSGTGVYTEDETAYVVHVGGNGLAVARFVAALVAALAGTAGIGIATTASILGGGIVLGVAALAAWLFVLLGKMRSKLLTRPPNLMPCFVTLHIRQGAIRDHQGKFLGAIAEARLELVFQATSSARALALVLPKTKLVIARGNPFAGDVGPIIEALARLGVRPPA